MCKLQTTEVHMQHKHATSQDFYREFMTLFQQIITSVQVVGFLMQRLICILISSDCFQEMMHYTNLLKSHHAN